MVTGQGKHAAAVGVDQHEGDHAARPIVVAHVLPRRKEDAPIGKHVGVEVAAEIERDPRRLLVVGSSAVKGEGEVLAMFLVLAR